MRKIKHIGFLFLFLFNVTVYAQLSNFNFNVVKTDETCLGNGSLTFTVENTTPNASLLYKVYRLPNTNSTIAVVDNTYLGGLNAGTYKVVAVQSLGSMQNTKEQTVTIDDRKTVFNFSITSANQNCLAGGSLVLAASPGNNIATCEIIGVRPLQTSNVFDGLPAGTYNVRAYNDCGAGKVKTFTLSVVNATLRISNPTYPDTVALCDSITVNNIITPSAGVINYPIRVKHTLSTMDISGNSIVVERVYATGSPTSQEVSVVMPRYMNQEYTYDVEVVDNCADTPFLKEGVNVNQDLAIKLTPGLALCGEKFLKLNVSKFTDSYTVEFLGAPTADFDASTYNTTPFGPFTAGSVQYGDDELSLPFGNYTIKVTDRCGRTATETVVLEFTELNPNVSAQNNGCFSLFGRITVSISRQKVVTAAITEAPILYTGNREVTSQINAQGRLILTDMPLGWYTIEFTDDCGFFYRRRIEVKEYVDKLFNIATLPSCTEGLGTIRFRSANDKVTQASITVAPAEFALQHPLPFDATSMIDNAGNLYMDNLPEGSYIFEGVDACGALSGEIPVNVQGYVPPVNPYVFTPRCGGFSVKVTDRSNGLEGASYWLQKFNTVTGKWAHPGNLNSVYVEGQVPTTANAIQLTNNSERNNLTYSGTFRIVKKFESFGNSTARNTLCISTFEPFHYTEQLAISTVYSLACLQRPNDVMVEVAGYPTAYKIIRKNGQSFVVNNGTNNTFTNLTPGEYVFQIQDNCGNIETKTVFLQTLPTSSDPVKPNDMVSCVDAGEAANAVFHLTDQNTQVLGPLFSSMYDITYHLTQADADAGTNALPEFYPSTHDGQVIYVRMQNNIIALCGGTTSFSLYKGYNQEPVITREGTICNEGMIKLVANEGYDKYLWSTGETTRSIFVNEAGDYTLTVFKKYGNNFGCPGFAEVSVEQSFTPEITKIETLDWTTDENMIVVHTQGADEYSYSIDGVKYQTSNVFTGLEPGRYTIYVKNTKGCGMTKQEVTLLNYPKFFTPNGDGSNETWQIKNSATEPHMHVTIYDRYGKLLTAFGSDSKGWDGTLNGIQLPSTDYWFVVTREDGRELKGHFSMMR